MAEPGSIAMRLFLGGVTLLEALAKSFPARRARSCILFLVSLAGAGYAFGQASSVLPASKPAAASQPAGPTDPLGRETPRGTLIGFVRAAQDESERAIEYFQPASKGHRDTPGELQELAVQLYTVLNARFDAFALSSISNDPEGRGEEMQPRDQIKVGGTRGVSESFPITLIRLPDQHGAKLWYISRQTLDQVPAVYDSLRFPQLEKNLPTFLVKYRPLGMPAWQWMAIILLAPVALASGWALALAGRAVRQLVRRLRGLTPLPPQPLRRFGPGAMLLGVIIHYTFVAEIGTSLLYRQYYQRIIVILLASAGYWAALQVTHWVFRGISGRLTERGRLAERSLVSLSRRVLDVAIFVAIALYVLTQMEVNVTAALAGLGIGGLAIGLGAQKTFENLLGGISILTDKAVVVGDPCKIGDRAGTVEDIGLRSTKIRTEDRTLVSIPNGTVATATLENFRFRDKVLFKQTVRLRYDLSPDHLRYVLAQLRELLVQHAKVEESTARVRLTRFGDYALEVELYAYILERDYGAFLATQEDVMLQVMETLERTGGAVALPTQTTTVAQDGWVDPAKAAAAAKAIEKSRDPGVPGLRHPELAPDGERKKA
jgi:MscS family membrane protein